MESRRDIVIDNHYSGCNCSQSVFLAYYDLFDAIKNREAALKLALPFGGGLARTQLGLCGAVSAGAMLLGLKYSPSNSASADEIWEYHNIVRSFLKDFEEKTGSVYCKDIVGCDITTPEAYIKAHDNMENYCVKVLHNAVDLLESKYNIFE